MIVVLAPVVGGNAAGLRRTITEVSDGEHVLTQTVNRVGNLGCLEHRSDAGKQFPNVQRFGQEIIGSSLQTRLNAMPVRLTGDDDDRDLLSIGNRLNGHAECQSVDMGHTNVQQDEVGLDLEGLLDAVLAVNGGTNLHAFGRENALKDLADARIVIDHQDLLLAHTMPSPGRRFL